MDFTKKNLKDIKSAVSEGFEPLKRVIQDQFRKNDEKVDALAQTVQGEFKRLDGRMDHFESRMDRFENDFKDMRDTLNRFMGHVDELISIYKKHEMELGSALVQIARLEKRVEELEKKTR